MGVLFLNDAALRVFEQHGCDVDWDSKRVRMDRACDGAGGKAPSNITVTPRNPDRAIFGDEIFFWSGGIRQMVDLDQGRRIGTRVVQIFVGTSV